MKYTLQLYIADEWKSLDLDSAFNLKMNYQIKDYAKPADFKSSYSKTVTLNGTPRNNDIMSYIYNLSSLYVVCDPTKKIDYRLLYNGLFISSGYAVIDKISRKGNDIQYSLTLYDDLTKLLNNIKFKENGDTRYLSDLEFGFDDEFETYNYGVWYLLDSWKRLGSLITPDGAYDEEHNNSIKQYIVPIYINTGLYDDFDSNKILVNCYYFNNNIEERLPYIYNKETGRYDSTRVPIYNETFNGSGENQDYKDYRHWLLYEVSRDMHPTEAGSIMSDRLPLGIDLMKTWNTIVEQFNVDDSEVKYQVERYLKDTFMIIENQLSIESINNVKQISSDKIEHNDENIGDVKLLYNNEKPKITKYQSTKLNNSKNYKITITPRMNFTNVGDESVRKQEQYYRFGEQGYGFSPIGVSFDQGPYPPYASSIPHSRDKRPVLSLYDTMVFYTVDLYFVKVYRDDTVIFNSCYPIIGGSDVCKKYSNKEESAYKTYIENNIGKTIKDVFGVKEDSINTKYLWSDIKHNDANKDNTELVVSQSIEHFIDFTYWKDFEGEYRCDIETTTFTVLQPTTNGVQGAIRWINYKGGDYYDRITTNGSEYIISNEVRKFGGSSKINLSNFYTYGTDNILIVSNGRVGSTYRETIWYYDENYVYRIISKPMVMNGTYNIWYPSVDGGLYPYSQYKPYTLASSVSIDEYSGSVDFKQPEVNKNLLNNISVGDLFLNICKTLNLIPFVDDIYGDRFIKIVSVNDFYKDDIINLTDLVDFSNVDVKPSVVESSIYNYYLESPETYVHNLYKQNKQPEYNVKKVNFDFNINNEDIDVLDAVKFQTLLNYDLKSLWFNPNIINEDVTKAKQQYISGNKGFQFKQYFYKETPEKLDSIEEIKGGLMNQRPEGVVLNQYEVDKERKLCAFDKSLETVDLANTIVHFGGWHHRDYPMTFTEDIPATKQINGNFCYVLNPRRNRVFAQDPFIWDINTDMYYSGDEFFLELIDTPIFENKSGDVTLAMTNLDNSTPTNIWNEEFSDFNDFIFNVNNKKVTCQANFKGEFNINRLLRRIYYFDNAYWVVNRLIDFDIEKDFNKVEFVQVKYPEIINIQNTRKNKRVGL